MWAAIGHNSENAINLPIVIAAALWMTVLLIFLTCSPTQSSGGSTRACAARSECLVSMEKGERPRQDSNLRPAD